MTFDLQKCEGILVIKHALRGREIDSRKERIVKKEASRPLRSWLIVIQNVCAEGLTLCALGNLQGLSH